VKVLSWGDVAYPAKGQKASDSEINVARKRNNSLESYIEARYSSLKVETHNMAERPTALQELLNSSDARVKSSLEQAGIAGAGVARPSRAIVMVIVR